MEKHEVISAFCELSSEVMREKFSCDLPADCFCDDHYKPRFENFQFSELIIDFIKEAVAEKLESERV